MFRFIFVLTLCLSWLSASSQSRYFTKSGTIRFESKTPLEDIEAVNNSVTCVFDASSGDLQFSVLIRGFQFPKALMQEHFNENYMESDKFPRSEFRGSISNFQGNLNTASNKEVNVSGKLTIHNVTRDVQVKGIMKADGSTIRLTATFPVRVEDYNIKVPSLVRDKIARTVNIFVDCELKPLNK